MPTFKLMRIDGQWVLSYKRYGHRTVMVFVSLSAALAFIDRVANPQDQSPQP